MCPFFFTSHASSLWLLGCAHLIGLFTTVVAGSLVLKKLFGRGMEAPQQVNLLWNLMVQPRVLGTNERFGRLFFRMEAIQSTKLLSKEQSAGAQTIHGELTRPATSDDFVSLLSD